jgi:hypothetical protein
VEEEAMTEYSYNGWRASPNAASIGIDPNWEPIPGHKLPGGIKAGDVEVVMTYCVRQLHMRVEPIDTGGHDDWGYAYRKNRNANNLSCHASGTAFDWNATRHPNGKRGTFTTTQVQTIHDICDRELAGVVKWGGDFSGTKDEMHFEIHGTAQQVAAVAARLRVHAQAEGAATTFQEDDLDDTQAYELKSVFEAVGRLEQDNVQTQRKLDQIAQALAKLQPPAKS